MMIVIGLFTVILVLDCLLLLMLVLVQLPKKEAGIGQAFGGAATDALFGAGSGNALTKMTKYATAVFFILTLAISIMFNMHARNRGSGFERSLGQTQPALPTTPVGSATGVGTPATPASVPANSGTVNGTVNGAANGAAKPAPSTTTTPAPATTTPAPAANTPATK
jgi:preprotein translocase subunit SecG